MMGTVRRLKKSAETKGDGAADQIAPPVSDFDTRPEDLPDPEDYFSTYGVDGSLPPPFDAEEDLTDDHPPDAK